MKAVQGFVEPVDARLEVRRNLGLLLDELLQQLLVSPDDSRQLFEFLVKDIVSQRRAELGVLLEDGEEVFKRGDGGHELMPVNSGPLS